MTSDVVRVPTHGWNIFIRDVFLFILYPSVYSDEFSRLSMVGVPGYITIFWSRKYPIQRIGTRKPRMTLFRRSS